MRLVEFSFLKINHLQLRRIRSLPLAGKVKDVVMQFLPMRVAQEVNTVFQRDELRFFRVRK